MNWFSENWPEIFAVVLSSLAISISLWELLSNRPKIRSKLKHAFPTGIPETEFLAIEFINFGRQPTTISAVYLMLPNGLNAWPQSNNFGSAPPHFLEVGKSTTMYYPGGSTIELGGSNPTLINAVFDGQVQVVFEHTWSKGPIQIPKPKSRNRSFLK